MNSLTIDFPTNHQIVALQYNQQQYDAFMEKVQNECSLPIIFRHMKTRLVRYLPVDAFTANTFAKLNIAPYWNKFKSDFMINDQCGDSPLHVAIACRSDDISVKILQVSPSDALSTNNYGKIALNSLISSPVSADSFRRIINTLPVQLTLTSLNLIYSDQVDQWPETSPEIAREIVRFFVSKLSYIEQDTAQFAKDSLGFIRKLMQAGIFSELDSLDQFLVKLHVDYIITFNTNSEEEVSYLPINSVVQALDNWHDILGRLIEYDAYFDFLPKIEEDDMSLLERVLRDDTCHEILSALAPQRHLFDREAFLLPQMLEHDYLDRETTCLNNAIYTRRWNIASLLVDKFSEFNALNEYDDLGFTPMHHAVTRCTKNLDFLKNRSLIHLLANAGASLKTQTFLPLPRDIDLNEMGLPPLFLAIWYNNVYAVETLVDLDPELLQMTDSKGRTALHFLLESQILHNDENLEELKDILIGHEAGINYDLYLEAENSIEDLLAIINHVLNRARPNCKVRDACVKAAEAFDLPGYIEDMDECDPDKLELVSIFLRLTCCENQFLWFCENAPGDGLQYYFEHYLNTSPRDIVVEAHSLHGQFLPIQIAVQGENWWLARILLALMDQKVVGDHLSSAIVLNSERSAIGCDYSVDDVDLGNIVDYYYDDECAKRIREALKHF